MAVEIRSLAGQTVVVTGKVDGLTRDEVELAIHVAGGKSADSVNAATTLIVIGEKPGASKLNGAARFGTTSITAAEFLALIDSAI
jgi:DNA ligase (NAD+)